MASSVRRAYSEASSSSSSDDDTDSEEEGGPANKLLKLGSDAAQLPTIEGRTKKGFCFHVELKRCRHASVLRTESTDVLDVLQKVFGVDTVLRYNPVLNGLRDMIVKNIVLNSPAYHDGRLKPGDEILVINGKDFKRPEKPPDEDLYSLYDAGNVKLKLYRVVKPVKDRLFRTDFGDRLFLNSDFADVVFAVKKEEIPAHKLLIAERSPVFNAMFRHDMKERQTNRVDITDIDPSVFKSALRFIYTSKFEPEEESYEYFLDVARVADKYAIRGLKECCLSELNLLLTKQNAAGMLIATEQVGFQVNALKERILIFMSVWAEEMMETPDWDLLENYPRLLMELFRVRSKTNDETQEFLKALCDAEKPVAASEQPEANAAI